MQNPLDITSATSASSLMSAFRANASKPDASDGDQFAGVFNQALQASSQDANTSKATSTSSSNNNATHKTEENEPTNKQTETDNPLTKAKAPEAKHPTNTTSHTAENKSAHAPTEGTPSEPTDAQSGKAASDSATDQTMAQSDQPTDDTQPKTDTPEIGLTIGAVPIEPQPLNLALLQAAAPLLSQQLTGPLNAPAELPTGATSPATDAKTPIDPMAGGTTAASLLPPTASSIALQALNAPGGAFGLPGLNAAAKTPAGTTETPDGPSTPLGNTPLTDANKIDPKPLLGGLTPAADPTATLNTTTPLTGEPIAAASALMLSGAMANATKAADLGTEAKAAPEAMATAAIGTLSGLNTTNKISNNTPVDRKPNATLPTSGAFQESLNSIQASLKEMQGEIESTPKSHQDELADSSLTPTLAADTTGLTASDLIAGSGLSGANPTAASGSNGDNSLRGIPTFNSTAENPTAQIAEGTAYSVKNGHKELIIRLNPDNLGEVKINLTTHGNQQLSARLIASTPESHELLKGQLDSLKTSLTAQGISVDRLSVVLAGSAESSGSKDSTRQEQTFSQEQSQNQQNPAPGSFQQQFNQQNPASAGLFSQMNGQSQSGFGQNQSANQPATGTEPGTSNGPEGTNNTPAATGHDNGRISILA